MKKQEYILTAAEEKRVAKERIRQRVIQAQDKLINAQLSLAFGNNMLFKIVLDEEGNKKRPELVTSPQEIADYLAGDYENSQQEYYFIMTEKPDNKAIDSLLNRAFGKPETPTEDDPTADQDLGVIAYPTLQSGNEPLQLPDTNTNPQTISITDNPDGTVSLEATTDTGTSAPISS